ncbi:uncharacterized protein LOC144805858 isoform X2 [Lissotriton helveticus]
MPIFGEELRLLEKAHICLHVIQSVIAADGVKPRSKHITKGQLSNGHQLGSSVNSSVFVIDLHVWLVSVCPSIVPDNSHR